MAFQLRGRPTDGLEANSAEGGDEGRGLTPGRCLHCGFPIEGSHEKYCCSGCEIAADIVKEAGLERYYLDRTDFAPRPGRLDGAWDQVPFLEHDDGTREVRVAIDGLRCASCVWLSEHVLGSIDGVHEAHVSYGTGRARIRWDPNRASLPALVRRIAALGYQPRTLGEEPRPDRSLMMRLGVAAFGAMNIMLVHVALYAAWGQGMEPRFLSLFQWTALVLATPLALWCADPFYKGAWQGLKKGRLHMDLPIAIAVFVLYAHGVFETLNGGETYLDSLGMLVTLLLAGRVLESRGRRRAAEAAVTLSASVPSRARRWSDGGLEVVAADALRPGDLIELAAGEEAAADGVVTRGQGRLDRAIVTGESEPAHVAPGDEIVAGSSLIAGSVEVRVSAVGDQTLVGLMAEEVRRAADQEGQADNVDRMAPWFTAATLTVATLVFLGWLATEGLDRALPVTVAVLVVACPCALALSRPLTSAAGLGAAARRGLLLRSGDVLMKLAEIDLVALDKTGTVTAGERAVVSADDRVIRVASGLERSSVHPIARAVVEEARVRGIPLPAGESVEEIVGVGIRGFVDGEAWSLRADARNGVGLFRHTGGDWKSAAVLEGSIQLADRVRSTSAAAVRRLGRAGVDSALLSGDAEGVAQRIGAEVGVGEVHGQMLPKAKAEWIRSRRDEGRCVLFAGDGLNDGPALAAADVGLAMRRGAASTVLVADGVVVSDSLESIVAGIEVARVSRAATRESRRRSVLYNVVAVGAAAAGFINPLVAAILMPASSGLVLLGAARVEPRARKRLA